MPLLCHGPHGFQNRTADRDRGLETCLETVPRHVSRHPTLRFLRKLFTFFASVRTNLLIYANEVRSSIIEPCAIIAVLRRACSIVWK